MTIHAVCVLQVPDIELTDLDIFRVENWYSTVGELQVS